MLSPAGTQTRPASISPPDTSIPLSEPQETRKGLQVTSTVPRKRTSMHACVHTNTRMRTHVTHACARIQRRMRTH